MTHRKYFFLVFTIVSYFAFTVYYMGPSALDCTNTVGGIGDNTAGPIWKFENTGSGPVGGYSNVTNYPFGESLSGPVDVVVSGQSVLLWSSAKVFGPVCGYNAINIISYVSAALVMFFFVRSMLRGRYGWIAWIAGYAVAFAPFYQVKIGGHPSYGFQAILIGVIWAFFSLITRRRLSSAIILAILTVTCFYFDPYFSLLVSTILVPLVVVWAIYNVGNFRKKSASKNTIIKELKLGSICLAIIAIAVLPLLYVMTSQSAQIKDSVAGTRDNIVESAKLCSNWPQEYLLPFPDSPAFKLLGGESEKVKGVLYAFSQCGIAEDSVGIAIVMLAVILLFFVVLLWEYLNRRKSVLPKILSYNPAVLISGLIGISFTAIILALPPFHVLGFPLPSLIMVEMTSVWRIISREYVVLNIAVVILFSLSLAYFSATLKLKRAAIAVLAGLLFSGIFIQYQTYTPFRGNVESNFSYSNAPTGYYWLKGQESIRGIAEYPIEKATEASSHGYFLTMQSIHRKPILNSALATSSDDPVRSSIKNLKDPLTPIVLRSLGVDAVVVHGVGVSEIESIPYLKVIYSGDHKPDGRLPDSPAVMNSSFVIAKIIGDTPFVKTSFQFLDSLPRNREIQKSATSWEYEVPSGSRAALRSVMRGREGDDANVCFSIKMAATGDTGVLDISGTKMKAFERIMLSDQYYPIRFEVPFNQTIAISNNNGRNMQITNIGCLE